MINKARFINVIPIIHYTTSLIKIQASKTNFVNFYQKIFNVLKIFLIIFQIACIDSSNTITLTVFKISEDIMELMIIPIVIPSTNTIKKAFQFFSNVFFL